MRLASHNSWSYLKPKKWCMRLFNFASKCQDADIETQYNKYGVRCFDLRIRFNNITLVVAHGCAEYSISSQELEDILMWLNSKKDAAVRVILEVRTKWQYSNLQRSLFRMYCSYIVKDYPNIKFWGGRNLYNWEVEYDFTYAPSCEEKYASVCSPKIIDDWYPRWFAKKHTKEIIEKGSSKDYLMVDFVNYQS